MTKTRGKKGPEVDLAALDELSHTELAQVCRLTGHPHAWRHLSRETLTDLILGLGEEPNDPLIDIRERIAAWVSANRRIINASLMDCDLECAVCPHSKVLTCYTTNKDKVDSL